MRLQSYTSPRLYARTPDVVIAPRSPFQHFSPAAVVPHRGNKMLPSKVFSCGAPPACSRSNNGRSRGCAWRHEFVMLGDFTFNLLLFAHHACGPLSLSQFQSIFRERLGTCVEVKCFSVAFFFADLGAPQICSKLTW